MIVEELFETTIYPNLKKHVENTSIYKPRVTKKQPQESKIFPIVPVKLLPITNKYNNLSYGEETFDFGIEIDIYAQDQTIDGKRVSKRTICNEITNIVINYLKKNYHVIVKAEYDAINIDDSIHRNNIKITCKLDTKYGLNNLVIYPN